MPYQCEGNYNSYVEHLCMLENIIYEANTNSVAIVVDINANRSTLFGVEIMDFQDRLDLIMSDAVLLSDDSFTCVSEAHGTTSWLDHGICSLFMHYLVNNILNFR